MGLSGRRQRFEPLSHPQWWIVEISNRPQSLSTKKNIRQGKNLSANEKALFCPKIAKKIAKICQKLPKIAQKFAKISAQNNLLKTLIDNPLRIC